MQKYLLAALSTLFLSAADLSLAEAARLALNDNPAIAAARSQESAAATQIGRAHV